MSFNSQWKYSAGKRTRTRTTTSTLSLMIVTAEGDLINYSPGSNELVEAVVKRHYDACQTALGSQAIARLSSGIPCAFGRATLQSDGVVFADAGTSSSPEFWKPAPKPKMQVVDLKNVQQLEVENGVWKASRKGNEVFGKPDCLVTLVNNVANAAVFVGLADAFRRGAIAPTAEREDARPAADLLANTFVNMPRLPLPTIDVEAPNAVMGRATSDGPVADARWVFDSPGNAATWFATLAERATANEAHLEIRTTAAGPCSVMNLARADAMTVSIVCCQNVVARIVCGGTVTGWRLRETMKTPLTQVPKDPVVAGTEFVDMSIDAIAKAIESR